MKQRQASFFLSYASILAPALGQSTSSTKRDVLIEFFLGIVIARRDVTELQNHARSNPLARPIPAKPGKGLRRILYCSAISPRWRERGGGEPNDKRLSLHCVPPRTPARPVLRLSKIAQLRP